MQTWFDLFRGAGNFLDVSNQGIVSYDLHGSLFIPNFQEARKLVKGEASASKIATWSVSPYLSMV